MNMTTTETNWLAQFTQRTQAAMLEALKLRKRDYDGFVPADVAAMRIENAKTNKRVGSLAKVMKDLFKKGIGDIDSHVG
jgi:hypothetical protein